MSELSSNQSRDDANASAETDVTLNALHILRKARVEGRRTCANFTNTKIDLAVKKINSSLTNGSAECERKKNAN